MKSMRDTLNFAFAVVSAMILLVCDAQAQLNMPEKEEVQAVAWAIELVAFLIIMGIVLFIWRISKKESENRRSKRDSTL